MFTSFSPLYLSHPIFPVSSLVSLSSVSRLWCLLHRRSDCHTKQQQPQQKIIVKFRIERERERELKLRENEKVEEVDHWIRATDQASQTTFRICMRLSTATFTLCVGSTWLPTIIAVIWRQWPKPNDSMSKKRKREREATKLKTASVSSFLFLLLQLLLLLTAHSWQRQRRTPCWKGRLLKTYDYLSYLFFPLFDQNTHKPNYTNHLTIEWL